MSANDRQVGGQHYRTGIQHWDYVAANGLSYLGGQVTKYAMRWRRKNGAEDVEKAIHFLQKMKEIHLDRPLPITFEEFRKANIEMSAQEAAVVYHITRFEATGDLQELERAKEHLTALLAAAARATIAPA